jgi:hypothetical protein
LLVAARSNLADQDLGGFLDFNLAGTRREFFATVLRKETTPSYRLVST